MNTTDASGPASVSRGRGGVSRLSRLCGSGWSKWLSVAGEKIDADTARIAGFVQAVYPREGFEEKVLEFCRRLAGRPAEAQGAAKLAVELAWDLDRTQARNVERLVNTPLMLRDNSEHVKKAFGKKPKD